MEAEALANSIIHTLRASRRQAYLVGGCVRDLLLGCKPKDFDVATDAPPGEILKLFPGSGCVGAHFGVVLVHEEGAQVEVATFRSDRDYADGRRATSVHFESEPATFEAIRRNHALIRTVWAERVRDELIRILPEGGARRGFELLDATGLLDDLLPEVAAMKGVAQPPEFHPEGDVWVHTLLLLDRLAQASPTLALGALLHDVGKPPTFRIA